jgi:sugar O-acyltransferase (sialic acid O-acetyltransferase NeuD family)
MRILLWGARSQARIVQDMLTTLPNCATEVVFDATMETPAFPTEARFINSIGKLRDVLRSCTHFVVCVGAEHGYARHQIALALEEKGLAPLTLTHGEAFIEPSASYGKGCQFMARSLLGKFSRVGDYVILNSGCLIDHECEIGHGCHIMGSAAVAGRVRIGDYVTIGTNATILPDVTVGHGAFVGAGAVVTKDVPGMTVCVGIPARVVRQRTLAANLDELRDL